MSRFRTLLGSLAAVGLFGLLGVGGVAVASAVSSGPSFHVAAISMTSACINCEGGSAS